jgi:hypothetical protein
MKVGDLVNGRFGLGIIGEVDPWDCSLKIQVFWLDAGRGMTWCDPRWLEVL